MVAGAPDESFLPRIDGLEEMSEEQIRDRAHEFAMTAADEDTLEALMELHDLNSEEKGEVIRLGLAELKKRKDAGHAERLLRLIEVRRRPMGSSALTRLRITRPA